MIHSDTRPLDEREKRTLSDEMIYLLQQKETFFRFTLILVLCGLVLGVMLAILQAQKNPVLGYWAFGAVGLYIGIFLWVYFGNTRDNMNRILELRTAMETGLVKVTHCQCSRVVALPEIAEEGPGFFLEVAEAKILFLGGPGYADHPDFPNSDFELIEICDANGKNLYFDIYCRGDSLIPEKTLDRNFKKRCLAAGCYPQDREILEGRLDDLETRLSAREKI
ncbi:MAG TPA: hypothetical protein PLT76_05370 [Candidatus Omnitrophota bacterium]|nr:hypothetical protein [Candidatus Omnitrophota bacterium]HPB67794.1 hypothetical protein [Candidatus Omnitrophota bacterium]HQO58132.1 hypothetical protein [Candidatus Omnitrophota bacterium]